MDSTQTEESTVEIDRNHRTIDQKQEQWHDAFDSGSPTVEIHEGHYRPFIITNERDCGVVVTPPIYNPVRVQKLQRTLLDLIRKNNLSDTLNLS